LLDTSNSSFQKSQDNGDISIHRRLLLEPRKLLNIILIRCKLFFQRNWLLYLI